MDVIGIVTVFLDSTLIGFNCFYGDLMGLNGELMGM